MIRDSLITDSRNFRFFNEGPGMLGPGPNCAGNCSILEARIGESLWPTSNDLQSDWTSKIPKNKYRYLFFVIFYFFSDSVIQNHQKLEKHHLFDFLHFETCSFNEILFIFVTSLSDSSSKNHHNFAVLEVQKFSSGQFSVPYGELLRQPSGKRGVFRRIPFKWIFMVFCIRVNNRKHIYALIPAHLSVPFKSFIYDVGVFEGLVGSATCFYFILNEI